MQARFKLAPRRALSHHVARRAQPLGQVRRHLGDSFPRALVERVVERRRRRRGVLRIGITGLAEEGGLQWEKKQRKVGETIFPGFH